MEYIKSIEEIKEMGLNPNKSHHVVRIEGTKRPQVWRKVFMNGDTVGFFILSRK